VIVPPSIGIALSRAGADEPDELVEQVYAMAESQKDVLASSGLFAEPVPIANGDQQAQLIGLTGRTP